MILFAFAGYHTFLALSNTTTNERSKRGWIQQGINVHSHHEIHALQPYYNKIQAELHQLNDKIVELAYAEAGQAPPERNPTANDADGSATAPAGLDASASNPTTPSSTASSFPPPPYSPAVNDLMASYKSLKAEVQSVHAKLQRLESQEFVDDRARDDLVECRGSTAVSSVMQAGAARRKDGFTIAAVEATEGCVPTSVAAPPKSEASSTTKMVRRPNPYSLGIVGNFLQIVRPPRLDGAPHTGSAAAIATSQAAKKGAGARKPQGKKHR